MGCLSRSTLCSLCPSHLLDKEDNGIRLTEGNAKVTQCGIQCPVSCTCQRKSNSQPPPQICLPVGLSKRLSCWHFLSLKGHPLFSLPAACLKLSPRTSAECKSSNAQEPSLSESPDKTGERANNTDSCVPCRGLLRKGGGMGAGR